MSKHRTAGANLTNFNTPLPATLLPETFDLKIKGLSYGMLRFIAMAVQLVWTCGKKEWNPLLSPLHSCFVMHDGRYWSFGTAILRENLHEKCCAPKSRRKLCASLRGRNAIKHVTGTIWRENLHEKNQKPDGTPWYRTGLFTYRKNPSAWTRCLGENATPQGHEKNALGHLRPVFFCETMRKMSRPKAMRRPRPRLPASRRSWNMLKCI